MKPLPNRSNFVVGFVLYHPQENLYFRVEKLLSLRYRVYIFDNSPFGNEHSFATWGDPNITYLTAGKNVGIGYALSTLCATAYAHGYQQLLFLDQDTGISAQTVEFIETFPRSLPADLQQKYAVLVFNGQPATEHAVQEVRLAISSGSLFNLKVLQKIGWHNENYFVDCVDYELCLRARRCGYKICLIKNTPDLDHITEQPDRKISVFGKKILVRRYSTTRIKDALGAYIKLIIGGLSRNSLSDSYVLTRSMGLYIFGQLISRFIRGK